MKVNVVRSNAGLQALSHPLRVRILESLRTEGSAAEVARRLGESRQKINYHLKELEKAELVHQVDERRVGNFIETVYRAVASGFVIAPEVAWSDPRRLEALVNQHSLEELIRLGETVQKDVVMLLDRAAFEMEDIASASVTAELSFGSEEERRSFLREYVEMLGEFLERYGDGGGEAYKVLMAAYPDPQEE